MYDYSNLFWQRKLVGYSLDFTERCSWPDLAYECHWQLFDTPHAAKFRATLASEEDLPVTFDPFRSRNGLATWKEGIGLVVRQWAGVFKSEEASIYPLYAHDMHVMDVSFNDSKHHIDGYKAISYYPASGFASLQEGELCYAWGVGFARRYGGLVNERVLLRLEPDIPVRQLQPDFHGPPED